MILSHDRMSLIYEGKVLPLSRRPFRLVELLMRRPGVIRTRGELIEATYSGPGEKGVYVDGVYDRTIDSHIKTTRRKMRALFGSAHWISTRYGVGYVWDGEATILKPTPIESEDDEHWQTRYLDRRPHDPRSAQPEARRN